MYRGDLPSISQSQLFERAGGIVYYKPTDNTFDVSSGSMVARLEGRGKNKYLVVNNARVAISLVKEHVKRGEALFFRTTFSGKTEPRFAKVAQSDAEAKPRFVIVHHYRLTSLFGDYGAGKTVRTYSLWPGEETTLYVRSWRSTEERRKSASSVFDSYSTEAAEDFEQAYNREYSYSTRSSTSNSRLGGKS
jgi:hypothetical protein